MYYRNFCSLPSPSRHRIVAQHRVVDYSVMETELRHGTERMLLVLSANGAEIMYTRDEECTHGTPISIALLSISMEASYLVRSRFELKTASDSYLVECERYIWVWIAKLFCHTQMCSSSDSNASWRRL